MKIGALVPVRLTSERLPRKALLEICGRPIIAHLLDRIFASRFLQPENVVVCTTTDESDDPLVPVVEATGARVFRGSRCDIVDRFRQAVVAFGFDAVVQVDGDDPLAETQYMDACVDRLLADQSLGIVLTEGLPFGMGSKAIRASAIETVWRHHLSEQNDTGFIYYFTRTGLCRTDVVRPTTTRHQLPEARLTLDYPEDFAFFRALFDVLYANGKIFGIDEIVDTLRLRPDLVALNAGLDEEYWQRTRQLAQIEYQVEGRTYKVEV